MERLRKLARRCRLLSKYVRSTTVISKSITDRVTGLVADETQVEKIVRQYIKRGTVQVQVRIADSENKTSFRFNTEILNAYREQLQDFHRHHPMDGNVSLESLLNLPGVIEETTNSNIKEEAGPLAEQAIVAALKSLNKMRAVEGQAMGHDMLENIAAIKTQLTRIEKRIPQVTINYTTRLQERVTKLLEPYGTDVQPGDIAREVALFAERSDIAEEVVRLQSHLEQFCETMKARRGHRSAIGICFPRNVS